MSAESDMLSLPQSDPTASKLKACSVLLRPRILVELSCFVLLYLIRNYLVIARIIRTIPRSLTTAHPERDILAISQMYIGVTHLENMTFVA